MSGSRVKESIEILGEMNPEFRKVLNSEALAFIAQLHRKFNPLREELLRARIDRQNKIDQGDLPEFLSSTEEVRSSDWKVARAPHDLEDRRVEITGPVERKMMINALNSGAKVFMADFEDSLSPTWVNVVQGQLNLKDAIRKTLEFESPEGKTYKLNEKTATLVVRPRGWHLQESHVLIDSKPISASLFDFGIYFFNNAHELVVRKSGPYFYLPKIESHLEAKLWNEIFNFAQDHLRIPRGTIRATVLIETILASFEMDEILFELKDHMAGLNAGRWDYMFSAIKKFKKVTKIPFPDRSEMTMTVPFMRAYTELLVQTCHRRGAHAIGGMSAFIPSRKDPEVNKTALKKVQEDKQRESQDGFDGTWVAHPDLVSVAKEVFDGVLKNKPHQKDKLKQDVKIRDTQLIGFEIPGAKITENGLRNNISVALQYIESWLRGIGAVAIFNLMEDAATAEISRALLWQWVNKGAKLDDGRQITPELYKKICQEELEKIGGLKQGRFRETLEVLDSLVLNQSFSEFLTIPAYRFLKEYKPS